MLQYELKQFLIDYMTKIHLNLNEWQKKIRILYDYYKAIPRTGKKKTYLAVKNESIIYNHL